MRATSKLWPLLEDVLLPDKPKYKKRVKSLENVAKTLEIAEI